MQAAATMRGMREKRSGLQAPRDRALLRHDATHGQGPADLGTLAGIAVALRYDAASRFAERGRRLRARGDEATAAAFDALYEWERTLLARAEDWASAQGAAADAAQRFADALPPEIAQAWQDELGSTLLTPYRVFATAVDNKQRNASFFSYLAAGARDDAVRAAAEQLAVAELTHAAELRRWRRAAWRRERQSEPDARSIARRTVRDPQALDAMLGQAWADIRGTHSAVTQRLRALGDESSAAFLERLVADMPAPADELPASAAQPATIAELSASLPLLRAAQRPLEQLAERLEAILDGCSEGALFDATVLALEEVIALLSRLSRRAAATR